MRERGLRGHRAIAVDLPGVRAVRGIGRPDRGAWDDCGDWDDRGDRRERTGRGLPRIPPPSRPPASEGFHQVSGIGAAFRVPDDWKVIKQSGESVTYGDKSGRAGLTVGMVEPAGSSPMPHFTDMETNTKVNYHVYRRLRMQQTAFREQPAVVWEFTFQGRARSYRGIKLGFGREGGREDDIYLSASETEWDTYRLVFDKVTDAFAPIGR